MKNAMLIGLIAGTCVGAVVATMYKPARDAVRKSTDMVAKKAKDIATQVK